MHSTLILSVLIANLVNSALASAVPMQARQAKPGQTYFLEAVSSQAGASLGGIYIACM